MLILINITCIKTIAPARISRLRGCSPLIIISLLLQIIQQLKGKLFLTNSMLPLNLEIIFLSLWIMIIIIMIIFHTNSQMAWIWGKELFLRAKCSMKRIFHLNPTFNFCWIKNNSRQSTSIISITINKTLLIMINRGWLEKTSLKRSNHQPMKRLVTTWTSECWRLPQKLKPTQCFNLNSNLHLWLKVK